MLGILLLSIFIFIFIAIIIIEIRNERKYQEKRRQHRKTKNKHGEQPFPQDIPPKTEASTPKPKSIKKEKKLPLCTYPQFTHARLLEMGLSDEESKAFVQELIPQLEIQIPLIEEALKISDFHQMERLTHSIKGSSTNLGTGGISDLLVECNTYLKTGTDYDIAKAYLDHIKHYTQALKEQYTGTSNN